MLIEYKRNEKMLKVILQEEIDQNTVEKIKRKIDAEIEKYIPKKLVFDFDNISFMDSSGIGMILRKI